MSTWQSLEPRTAADVPWDTEREKRVLGGALRSWRRRERRHRAIGLSAAVAMIVLASHLLPRAMGEPTEIAPAHAVPAARLAPSEERARAVTPPRDVVRSDPNAVHGGFAGTGGHGGSDGHGGGAGTG